MDESARVEYERDQDRWIAVEDQEDPLEVYLSKDAAIRKYNARKRKEQNEDMQPSKTSKEKCGASYEEMTTLWSAMSVGLRRRPSVTTARLPTADAMGTTCEKK